MSRSASTDSSKVIEEMIIPGGCSDARAVFNLVMTAIGLGIMTLPLAFARAGWISGYILLVVAGAFVYYNVTLLCDGLCMNPENPKRPISSFEDLGRICYGKVATVINSVTLHPLMLSACAAFLILLATSMYSLTGVLSYNLWLLIVTILIMPFSCLKSMKEISFFSALGVASVFATVILVVIASIDEYVAETVDNDTITYHLSGGPIQLISVFCTFLLSFNVSITVPTIIKDVRRPQRFRRRVAFISFLLVGVVYLCITTVGYLAFGDSITNYDTMIEAFSPADRDDWTIYSWLINVCAVILVATHFLVIMSPSAQLSDHLLHENLTKKWTNRVLAEVVRCAFRILLVIFCALVALLVPSVDKLVNLLSAVFVVLIALVYPTVYYWRILQLQGVTQNRWLLWLQRVLVGIAFIALVFGTYMAVKDFF
ncbi:10 transmembrane domain, possible aa transporter, putative [Perkinsus marinus ATCC 50983]|uniref:10 transmembrane domain, possible aa transporter, putative n=1 Tax=Perkinsus marinus (strain ATCC 50983 / TXsc) TaxID=423536 RepID=C5LQH1_PERM5|nr:10 transmembrane domain, possible aa transporter, putative [Perkinsus marinus ATCC 50983]EER01017.1 10 transmembrane domain, possible aa transporter, putative [Perkinsus marinus ATCC 50983]|eukprot:XP_002768299.1 10 transmembrane domain, possible aa transporter, putative [Perkinsus marinus ATCC 50983]